jgi:phenylalanyl-tRNA synthetase beta chain
MKLPLRWLEEYLEEVPPVAILVDRLVMAGLEVESVCGPRLRTGDPVVVGRIAQIERHPNADRLSICSVEDGSDLRRIVCGASNVAVGAHVVVALPGATLPGGLTIRRTKIRGQESHGMICSATELGLWEDQGGILNLPPDTSVGEPAVPLLGLDDTVLDVAVTANRGDCLSIRGLARELSLLCGIPLTRAFDRSPPVTSGPARFRVTIESPEDCQLYRGVELSGVDDGPSPAWIVRKLAACGLRSIGRIVDVTNLILLEHGQPLHAFDGDRIQGRDIGVRTVTEPLSMQTLDDKERRLLPGDLAIWDAAGPIALAGIMGGKRTAIDATSRSLFLESASFRPGAVRLTSRRLGLISESSYRFERGVDPAGVERALLTAAALIAEIARGTRSASVVGAGRTPSAPHTIELRQQRITRILGTEYAASEVGAVLDALGTKPVPTAVGWRATIPSHRHDLLREIDLIEEAARLRGYQSIEPASPVHAMQSGPVQGRRDLDGIRVALRAMGMTEAVALAFCSERDNRCFPGLHPASSSPVVLQNPLRAENEQMRLSLLPALLAARDLNARNGVASVDLYSIGRTFARSPEKDGSRQVSSEPAGPDERSVIAGLLWGPRRTRSPRTSGLVEFGDVKAVVERVLAEAGALASARCTPCRSRREYHPGACAAIELGGIPVGYLGMIHPSVAQEAEIPFETGLFEIDTKNLLDYSPRQFIVRPVPRFPASGRDVCLVVSSEVLAGDVVAAVAGLGESLIETVEVFDEYTGEGIPPGHRALAFSLVYRASERTLTETEVSQLHARVVDHLVASLNVRVRT